MIVRIGRKANFISQKNLIVEKSEKEESWVQIELIIIIKNNNRN